MMGLGCVCEERWSARSQQALCGTQRVETKRRAHTTCRGAHNQQRRVRTARVVVLWREWIDRAAVFYGQSHSSTQVGLYIDTGGDRVDPGHGVGGTSRGSRIMENNVGCTTGCLMSVMYARVVIFFSKRLLGAERGMILSAERDTAPLVGRVETYIYRHGKGGVELCVYEWGWGTGTYTRVRSVLEQWRVRVSEIVDRQLRAHNGGTNMVFQCDQMEQRRVKVLNRILTNSKYSEYKLAILNIDATVQLSITIKPIVAGINSNGVQDFKPSWGEEKKDAEDPGNEDSKVPSLEEPRVNQEKDANVNNTNNINIISPTDSAAGIEDNAIDENIVYGCADDLNMPDLEEIGRFSDAEDDDAELTEQFVEITFILVSPIPTIRVHKDHLVDQIIGDLNSAPQTRTMTKNLKEHGLFSSVQQRTNHKDFQNCLFACFVSQEEPKKVVQALKDPSWIEAMQEKLL
ncbi:hypothetical protein Tco_1110783 [Tanacetum coccineum]|uniref:Uncharacterized protein n=1 Tax=Tanacetum coccineum TaxID=301880 RepID=A0ABQ5ILA8_9ASTR